MAKSTTSHSVSAVLTIVLLLLIARALFPDFFAGLGEGFTDGMR